MKIVHKPTLDLFRGPGRCEGCGRSFTDTEPHHVKSRGSGGSDIRINLIRVGATLPFPRCPCHADMQSYKTTPNEQLALVSAREGITVTDLEAVLSWIHRLEPRPTLSRIVAALDELPASAKRLAIKTLAESGKISVEAYDEEVAARKPACKHERLDMDGLCHACGKDCRGAG
jgi:hypothetical protein